ncbi:hypothetical protein GW756_02335 [bacterium]|nr:hypothetical protein [bacterium]NCQ55631.1 hypothetical protein [Candidatus Parcubacteria bacterium]NCS67456.1 hypothetical protein [Candidatus Peregrinibacteria bacterium]NCS96182.1 hypothetical protein [bacterium]
METANIFVQNPAFLDLYVFNSNAIILIGFTLLGFFVIQGGLLYAFAKYKSWWSLFFTNLVTAGFVWMTTIYFLYAPYILDFLF